MPTSIVPRRVELDAEHVVIEWPDGLTCRYPFRYLRLQCGCAGCVEEMTGRQILDVGSIPVDILAIDFMEVGRYAMQFLWTDGHDSGIYPYEDLRKLAEFDAVICEQA